jgi:hypothetical protein
MVAQLIKKINKFTDIPSLIEVFNKARTDPTLLKEPPEEQQLQGPR